MSWRMERRIVVTDVGGNASPSPIKNSMAKKKMIRRIIVTPRNREPFVLGYSIPTLFLSLTFSAPRTGNTDGVRFLE
ncbi:hypothetical protein ES703_67034 [subsurface metagenome]